ncbi:MAG TPA: TetR/AcrR family transcriptional regulator [Papillibacter sp.]|jgi:AcrR family transcriptional regulator|nr:TetR/AcrR family transcriptional regulator [Papillibacter sp.]
MEQNIKERIKRVAIDLFDQEGYHGTTIRTIASGAECSLPMVYYYYKNKKELFKEIILNDYFNLRTRHAGEITSGDVIEYYTQYIRSLGHLSDEEKKVFRLGLKVSLRFDGDEALYDAVDEWEKKQIAWHFQKAMPILGNVENWAIVIRTLILLLENMTLAIVLKNQEYSEDAIREYLLFVFEKGGFTPLQ